MDMLAEGVDARKKIDDSRQYYTHFARFVKIDFPAGKNLLRSCTKEI
jgi:hypothetical protein